MPNFLRRPLKGSRNRSWNRDGARTDRTNGADRRGPREDAGLDPRRIDPLATGGRIGPMEDRPRSRDRMADRGDAVAYRSFESVGEGTRAPGNGRVVPVIVRKRPGYTPGGEGGERT